MKRPDWGENRVKSQQRDGLGLIYVGIAFCGALALLLWFPG
jgi:hypothetical protein